MECADIRRARYREINTSWTAGISLFTDGKGPTTMFFREVAEYIADSQNQSTYRQRQSVPWL